MSKEEKEDKIIEQLNNEPLMAVESLKESLNLNDSIFLGVLAHKGWAKGKKVTKTEMNKAIQEFLNAPLK